MRIAVVNPCPGGLLSEMSVDPGLLVEGFRGLGHESFAVSVAGSEHGATYPVVVADDKSAFTRADYWKTLRLDAALVFTWLGQPEVVRALRRAGVCVLSKGDTDGLLGVRVHPRATFVRMYHSADSLYRKAGASWFWLKKYLYQSKQEDDEVLRQARDADALVVETGAAKAEVERFLHYHGAGDLGRKIHVVPNPVAPYFQKPAGVRKARKIIAVGRWSDPQKDGRLLARGLEIVLRKDSGIAVTLLGGGGEWCFGRLTREFANVVYRGKVSNQAVAEEMASSQILVFSSRWEGAPVAASEALSMGCTVVGPDIPAFADIGQGGDLGAVFRRRKPARLAAALLGELAAWDAGRRDEADIAKTWRLNTSPAVVCQQLMNIIDSCHSRPGCTAAVPV
jgi:glycosyltransferase involved in cell wall biosynthesis